MNDIVVRKDDFTLKGKTYKIDDIKDFDSEYIFKNFNVREWHYRYKILFKDNNVISDYLYSTGIDDLKIEYIKCRFLGIKNSNKIECPKSDWIFLYVVLFIDALILLAIYFDIISGIFSLVLLFLIFTLTPSIHYQLWMDNKPTLICKEIKFIFKKIEERGYY
jgi:hypothetical protein